MIDLYSQLEKSIREYTKNAVKIRAQAYADAVAREAADAVAREAKEARAELRDRFAAAALTGMHAKNNYHAGISTPQERARLAYIDADAMMEEREKRSQVDMEDRDQ
jgi:hypothetical protein